MELKGDFGYLELDVLTNKTLGSNDYWEENWLYTSVKAKFSGFTVDFYCDLRTDDFEKCSDEVSNLLAEITDGAKFVTLEEGVELHFQRDSVGIIFVKGKLTATELTKCSLEFSFSVDIPTMERFNIELHKIIEKYPIIGVP